MITALKASTIDCVSESTNSKLESLDKILGKVKGIDVEQAVEKIGDFGFFEGNVVRTVQGGIEIDTPTSLPTMVWCSDVADVPEVESGDRLLAFGKAAENRNGECVIYGQAIFKKD